MNEKPACLPAFLEGGAGETADAASGETVSLPTADQQRSIALLTDSEIGFDRAAAAEIATLYRFEDIRSHVFRARRDMAAGKITSYGAIRTRLERGYGASVLDSDRQSALWLRHQTHDDGESDLRRRYAPDEYDGIIIH